MSFNLENQNAREQLAEKIISDVNAYCWRTYHDGPRSHLGASLLGHECKFYLWLIFRWAHEENYIDKNGDDQGPRMMRLFNRGNREEERWKEWLRGAGWRIREYEPTTLWYHPESNCYFYSNETPTDPLCESILPNDPSYERNVQLAALDGVKPPQIRISFGEGHGGGSLDCEMEHDNFPGFVFLGEFKTFGDKPFAKLVGGVQKEKPQHWAQMCIYGRKRNIRYAVYCPINKNDDNIQYLQVLELDWQLADELLAKADNIILAQSPPPKLSENPAWRDCMFCGQYPVCHGGEAVDINCRSCRHAEPHRGGVWFCTKHGGDIPKDFIPKACPDHFPIIGPTVA